ncbi:MAG: hypothetical protein QNK03_12565 [Myxococcota bacterium]|nr:hypothetical protein [Myxococcota bacterium]
MSSEIDRIRSPAPHRDDVPATAPVGKVAERRKRRAQQRPEPRPPAAGEPEEDPDPDDDKGRRLDIRA